MTRRLNRFLSDESGATSVEYSLIAALIGVVIIAGVKKLGTNLSNKFSTVANSVS
jgi:pilus assembly protein Flp/PilA